MGNVRSSSNVNERPSPRKSENDIYRGSNRSPERSRSRHCFLRRSQRPEPDVGVLDAGTRCCSAPPIGPPSTVCSQRPATGVAVVDAVTRCCCPPPTLRSAPPPQRRSFCDILRGNNRTPEQNRNRERSRSRHCFLVRSQRPATDGAAESDARCCCVTPAPRPAPAAVDTRYCCTPPAPRPAPAAADTRYCSTPPAPRPAPAAADTRYCCTPPAPRPAPAAADTRCCCAPPAPRAAPAAADTRCCCTPPDPRPAPPAADTRCYCSPTGDVQSFSQVGRGQPQNYSETDVFHGTHRNTEQNRNRSCFLVRSQRPETGVCGVNPDASCCCSPPASVASPAPRPRQRCCYPMPKEEICPPAPLRQNACCSTGGKPQRCFNCPAYGGRGTRSGKECHPDAYPVPELLRNKPMCLHPLGARCNFDDRTEEVNEFPRRVAHPPPEGSIPSERDPSQTLSHYDSVKSFRPAVQAINENCEEPEDQYYSHSPPNSRVQGRDPLANFDLDRFDRDATHRGGGGRRRNVSIRTCVDYDYEPDYSTRERPYHRQGPPGYQSPRPHPPPSYAPRPRPPTAYPPQQQIQPRAPPEFYEAPAPEIDFVKCPYR